MYYGNDEKYRWFVFIGRQNFVDNPRCIYLCTTTTQIHKYKQNKKSVCVEFKEKDSCFISDCIVCLDEIETSFTEEEFNKKYKPEYKGMVSQEKLREIARKLKQADISPKVIKDILDSFKKDEVPTK